VPGPAVRKFPFHSLWGFPGENPRESQMWREEDAGVEFMKWCVEENDAKIDLPKHGAEMLKPHWAKGSVVETEHAARNINENKKSPSSNEKIK